jgi:hypothetical protein
MYNSMTLSAYHYEAWNGTVMDFERVRKWWWHNFWDYTDTSLEGMRRRTPVMIAGVPAEI